MITIQAPRALVGENLTLENICVTIDNGIIVKITKNICDSPTIALSESHLLVPGFVNPHVHLGDAFIKDIGLDVPLDQVVGKNGIKHLKFAQAALDFGANDFGGTLFVENISKSAGANYGEGLAKKGDYTINKRCQKNTS
ncbi:MAG: hypothetical protein ACTSYD_03790 [Candidatus Heimdallarchaeaceae archaeon]